MGVVERGVRGLDYEFFKVLIGAFATAPVEKISLLQVLWWIAAEGGLGRALRQKYFLEQGLKRSRNRWPTDLPECYSFSPCAVRLAGQRARFGPDGLRANLRCSLDDFSYSAEPTRQTRMRPTFGT